MFNYLLVAQILVAVVLITVILLQTRGGGLGGIFGQPDAVYRTRRGVEKTLFQFTIILTIVFVLLSIWIVQIA